MIRPRLPRSRRLGFRIRSRPLPRSVLGSRGVIPPRAAPAPASAFRIPSLASRHVGRTAEPDLALGTFDKVMAEMPAGVQLFSLLAANPSLLRLIADIMGTAPRLASILARRRACSMPCSIPDSWRGADAGEAQGARGQGARASVRLSDALDRARIVGREQGFLIGVRVISRHGSRASQAGAAYAIACRDVDRDACCAR